MTGSSDGIEDVDDGGGSEGAAAVPGQVEALITNACGAPRVEEISGETCKAGAVVPSLKEGSARGRVNQRETGKAGAAIPCLLKICTGGRI